jgi:hypothetical protein
MNLPVKKAAAYQLRVAVRDTASEIVGAANQFIEVPDVNQGRLTLSGLALSGAEWIAAQKPATSGAVPASAESMADTAEGAANAVDPQANPVVRVFRRGTWLAYGFMIFNSQVERATRRAQLEVHVRLFREGQLEFTGPVRPVDPARVLDPKRIATGGRLQLGTDMEPGDYVLQVVVTDKIAKEKHRTATQWIDFQIVQ